MNHKNEADILKEHGELTTEVTRLKGELGTVTASIAAKDAELTKLKADLAAKDGELTTLKATAAKVPTLEADLTASKAKVAELEAKDMDADKRAAATVAKAGIRGGSEKAEGKDEPKLTLSQQCLKARGVDVKPGEPVTLAY